jgi:hypothetical protein
MSKQLRKVATSRHPGEIWEIHGLKLGGVHFREDCKGETCVFHKPSDHHMREWKLHWRADRGIFERICPHGVGHPDPDQFEYWAKNNREAESVHGCDFCCRDTKDLRPEDIAFLSESQLRERGLMGRHERRETDA